jgi:hypothetical protein
MAQESSDVVETPMKTIMCHLFELIALGSDLTNSAKSENLEIAQGNIFLCFARGFFAELTTFVDGFSLVSLGTIIAYSCIGAFRTAFLNTSSQNLVGEEAARQQSFYSFLETHVLTFPHSCPSLPQLDNYSYDELIFWREWF